MHEVEEQGGASGTHSRASSCCSCCPPMRGRRPARNFFAAARLQRSNALLDAPTGAIREEEEVLLCFGELLEEDIDVVEKYFSWQSLLPPPLLLEFIPLLEGCSVPLAERKSWK